MKPEHVDELLKSYRAEVGRCKHLEIEIDILTKRIAHDKEALVGYLVGPGAQEITDMPRGTSIGNPTEKYGLMLADGWTTDEIKADEAKLAELEAEYAERHKTVVFVDGWLAGLPERERWMIEKQVIDAVIWRELITQYTQQYGEYRSKDTLKRLRDRALEMIYDMAE